MIDYRAATPADAQPLATLARDVFAATFGHLYPPEDFAVFAEAAFGPAGLPAHVTNPDYMVRLAVDGARLAGFAKLGPVVFPGEWPADAIELHQLYVHGDYHGAGVGPALMDWAIATARGLGRRSLILSVYIDNHRARRFYARYGFQEIGKYDFPVGNTIDEDILMRLAL